MSRRGHEALSLVYASAQHDADLCNELRQRGWSVELIDSAADLSRVLQHSPEPRAGLIDLADLSDLAAGGSERELNAKNICLGAPQIHWVAALTADQLRVPEMRELVGRCCIDYVVHPFAFDVVEPALQHAMRLVLLIGQPAHAPATPHEGAIVARSASMRRVLRDIRRVAQSDAPVFISGESGTGKELSARALHEASARASGPFVAINCCAVPPSLMQAELFGYERGAFTGAERRKTGRIEAANGGTLFLDEICDLPLECQATLLRFAEEGTIQPLGSSVIMPVDVRIISATHADLDAAVREETFRLDLFHRLCVVRIDVPPLRERSTDIHLLAYHLLAVHSAERRARLQGFTPSALRAMLRHDWPGNVRELANRVRRAVVMTEGSYIDAADLGLAEPPRSQPTTLAQARDEAERNCLIEALITHGNRLGEVAQELGISRVTLYRLLVRHDLREFAAGALRADVPNGSHT